MDWKIHHPFSEIPESLFAGAGPGQAGIVEHLRKCTYRISLPLLAHALGFGIRGAAILDLLAGILFIPVLLLHVKRLCSDPLTVALASASVACSLIGQWSMNDNGGFDGFPLLLLGLAALATNPALICLAFVAGGFADERVMLAAPLLWLYQSSMKPGQLNWRSVWRVNSKQAALLVSVLLFVALRLMLGHAIGKTFDDSGVGLAFFRSNLMLLELALLLTYKGSSILGGIGLASLLRWEGYLGPCLLAACMLPCIAASLLVYDLSRSLIYSFPALLICLRWAAATQDCRSLRQLALCAAGISVLMPTYYVLLRVEYLLPAFRLL